MMVVHIHVRVKPECVEAFKAATVVNARASLKEPGIVRFDVAQQLHDPTRFHFVEVYRAPEGRAAHRETSHYQTWHATVAPMMAEPRSSMEYSPVFPDESEW